MTDLISVIVPVYNIAGYVKRCIRSIFTQNHGNLEIIAIDDGSTDESLSVLQELTNEDQRLKIISQQNQGVTAARLHGVSVAKGDWIGFVDGDDEIGTDFYSRLLKNATDERADISHCGYEIITPTHTKCFYNTGRRLSHSHDDGLKELLEGKFIEPSLCNKLFKRDLFESVINDGLIDFNIKNLEDLLLNYYLFRAAKNSVYEDFCSYHYLKRKNSASTSALNEHILLDPLKVLNIIYNDVENPELKLIIKKRMWAQKIFISSYKKGNPMVDEYIREYREQLKRELQDIIHCRASIQFKCMALLAIVSPDAYRFIKNQYRKYTHFIER